MNVLTKIRLIKELSEKELRLGVIGTKSSWHNQYKDSAWIYVGSLPFELTEGDVICVCSQYGEVVHINLIRDKKTGKSKGFAFVCYEDQRSTILAVDNLNGAKIKGRQIQVDHKLAYEIPKEGEDVDELTMQIREKGVAPSVMHEYKRQAPSPPAASTLLLISDDESRKEQVKKKKKKKGLKKFLKEKPKETTSKRKKSYSSESSSESESDREVNKKKRKKEKSRTVHPKNRTSDERLSPRHVERKPDRKDFEYADRKSHKRQRDRHNSSDSEDRHHRTHKKKSR